LSRQHPPNHLELNWPECTLTDRTVAAEITSKELHNHLLDVNQAGLPLIMLCSPPSIFVMEPNNKK
jgi:hypothetical protein